MTPDPADEREERDRVVAAMLRGAARAQRRRDEQRVAEQREWLEQEASEHPGWPDPRRDSNGRFVFGSDDAAIARWHDLLRWLEESTGLRFGTPPVVWPSARWPDGLGRVTGARRYDPDDPDDEGHPPGWELRHDWGERDPSVDRVMAHPAICGAYPDLREPPPPPDPRIRPAGRPGKHRNLNLSPEQAQRTTLLGYGYDTVRDVAARYEALREAARALMAADPGVLQAFDPRASDTVARLACVPADVPVASGRGDRQTEAALVSARRGIVAALDVLRAGGGRRLSLPELTAAFVLAAPDLVAHDAGHDGRNIWAGRGAWSRRFKGGRASTPPPPIQEAAPFKALAACVKKDRPASNTTNSTT